MINGNTTTGTTTYDAQEGRNGCVFNPPPGAKNFVVTIVGGGGGGAGAGARSTVRKTYTDPGNYTFKTPEAGIYQFLAVGGGGGGGAQTNTSNNQRACTGSTGGLVYIPATVLSEDVKFNINVGAGGSKGWVNSDGVQVGLSGGDSSIREQDSNKNYATATGGGGGCSYRWSNVTFNFGKLKTRFDGWNSSGSSMGLGLNAFVDSKGDTSTMLASTWIENARKIYSAKGGTGSSDLYNAIIYNGKRLNSLATSDHQNRKDRYNMLPSLTNYNDTFDMQFNNVVNKLAGVSIIKSCQSASWDQYILCKEYSNHYGAGGGGGGDYNTDNRQTDINEQDGIGGFVGIAYRPVFAGLGGQAGKTVQIPYAEMPSKTILFPGKGGLGGSPAPQIVKSAASGKFYNVSQSRGQDGQSSYLKNGTEILGGVGGKELDPSDDTTYSGERNSQMMPIGGNGKMSDILTSKKVGNGGLGGLNKGEITNTSISGMTQTVFRNNAAISSFKNIYGAGSGGGGGTVGVNGTSLNFGNGGNGTSGLVFIQW